MNYNKEKAEVYIKDEYSWGSPSNERTIQVEEQEERFTGLYDKDGKPLYRKRERIGYI